MDLSRSPISFDSCPSLVSSHLQLILIRRCGFYSMPETIYEFDGFRKRHHSFLWGGCFLYMRGKRRAPSGIPIVRTGDQNKAHHCRKTRLVRSKNESLLPPHGQFTFHNAHAIKISSRYFIIAILCMSSSSPKFREKRMSNDAIYFKGWRHGV